MADTSAQVIARAKVAVAADTSAFDDAMSLLSARAKKDTKAAMDAIQAEMDKVKLQLALAVGTPGQTQAVDALRSRLDQLNKTMEASKMEAIRQAAAMDAVAQAQQKAANNAGRGAAGFKNFGYGVLMVSQAVGDLQYGFSAIVNNIPMIAMAFGASQGVAGYLSLAAVAINVLIKNWDQLMALFGQSKVKTQAEEMEELRKKTKLTADEAERLRRAEAVPAKMKELQAAKSTAEQESETAASKAITEAGLGNVVEGIMRVDPSMVDQTGDAAIVNDKIAKLQKERDLHKKLARSSPDSVQRQSSSAQALDIDKQIRGMTVGVDSEREQARRRTAMEMVAKGTLPGGVAKFTDTVGKDPSKFGPHGATFFADLKRIAPLTPEQRDAQRRDEAQKGYRKDAKDLLQGSDKDESAEEDLDMAVGQKRLDEARKNLARILETDPYAKGEVAAAEKAFAKALEDQKAKRESIDEAREGRKEKMDPYLTAEERAQKDREHEQRRDEARVADNAGNEELRQNKKGRAREAGKGLEDRYRMELLRDTAKGQQTDRAGMEGRVAKDLQKSGSSAEEAKEFAPEIVAQLMKESESRIRERANSEGVSREHSAYQEAAQITQEAQSKDASRGMGGFTDSVSAYQKLQASQDAKDPYQKSIAESNKQIADDTRAMLRQIKANGNTDRGGLAGPQ